MADYIGGETTDTLGARKELVGQLVEFKAHLKVHGWDAAAHVLAADIFDKAAELDKQDS